MNAAQTVFFAHTRETEGLTRKAGDKDLVIGDGRGVDLGDISGYCVVV